MLITFDCVRVGALSELFVPVAGACSARAPARLLADRAMFWDAQGQERPMWPFAPALRIHTRANWMARHISSPTHTPAAFTSLLCSFMLPSSPVQTPALELMLHDPSFRARARLLLLIVLRDGRLDADALRCVILRLAQEEADDALRGFMPGAAPHAVSAYKNQVVIVTTDFDFTHAGFAVCHELPTHSPVRLLARRVQPPSASWAPLRLAAASVTSDSDDDDDLDRFTFTSVARRLGQHMCCLLAAEDEGATAAQPGAGAGGTADDDGGSTSGDEDGHFVDRFDAEEEDEEHQPLLMHEA